MPQYDGDYVEIAKLDDILVTGLADIELVSADLFRFWFYAEENLVDAQRVVRAKLVVPRPNLILMHRRTARFLERFQTIQRSVLHH